jgi:hypothetical protein
LIFFAVLKLNNLPVRASLSGRGALWYIEGSRFPESPPIAQFLLRGNSYAPLRLVGLPGYELLLPSYWHLLSVGFPGVWGQDFE